MFNGFARPQFVFLAAILLRVVLLAYGSFQDKYSPLKYTDIDYFVFTDAARFMSSGRSPYARDTYRYTPLLAWLLLPTTWGGWWFSFGKVLFAASDIVAGWLVLIVLRSTYGMDTERALKYASLWLLNPMVAQISTRGSSEGLLAVMVMAVLWATLRRRFLLAGSLLGLAVHFKIYPFVYGTSIVWWLDEKRATPLRMRSQRSSNGLLNALYHFFNLGRLKIIFAAGLTFLVLNIIMFSLYGGPFLLHTYLYHIIRTDHRHNFSPYNLVLYLNSSPASPSTSHPESIAFFPQLVLSALAMPCVLAKKDLPSTLLAQTFCFVTFNKVCTSQYFLWYMIFLPFYLPSSSLLQKSRVGLVSLALWVFGQVLWLQQGYQLEFLGRSAFIPGLWLASISFYLVNIWILGNVISDIRNSAISRIIDGSKKSS